MVDNIKDIACELLQKYGSKTGVSEHSAELIEKYGISNYAKILECMKQLWLESHNEEYEERQRKLNAAIKKIKSFYQRGGRYAFVIIDMQMTPKNSIVQDRFGRYHHLLLPNRYKVGDKISCVVLGYQGKVTKSGHRVNLELEYPRKLPAETNISKFEPILAPHYKVSPKKLGMQLQGLDKHLCGKPFTCSCCGRDFQARKGYKMDNKEIYLCKDCKQVVFPPMRKGSYIKYISTPMGNKR